MECALLQYLKQCAQLVRSGAVARERLHVVLGNESCDLDSVISALSLAFYRHKINHVPRHVSAVTPSVTSDRVHVLAMLNIVRRDFPLRTESRFALQRYGITADHLTFRDDLDLSTLSNFTLTLVDHNVMASSDSKLEPNVCDVIDHHQRTRPESTQCDVEIEMVGSCCTLVADKLLSDSNFTPPPEIIQMLRECILMDTVCLSEQAGRKTAKDEHIVVQLEHQGGLNEADRQQAFDVIDKAKSDVSGLTVEQLLRKDLKFIREQKLSLAMSSVPMHIHDFLKRQEMSDDLVRFCDEQQVGGVVVMSLNKIDSGAVQRQIAVFCREEQTRNLICDTLVGSKNPGLKLDNISIENLDNNIRAFSQGDVTASRKKVLPLLQDRLKTL